MSLSTASPGVGLAIAQGPPWAGSHCDECMSNRFEFTVKIFYSFIIYSVYYTMLANASLKQEKLSC